MSNETVTSSTAFSLILPNCEVKQGVIFANLASPVGKALDVPVAVSETGDFPSEGNLALVNATGGAVALTLPAGSPDIVGRRFSVIKTDNSGNDVTMVPTGSDTIEGASAVSAPTRYARRDVIWSGDMWRRASTVLSSSNFLTTTGNLVGIADPKVARQAIGANEHCLTGHLSTVEGALAEVAWVSWPYKVGAGNAYVTDWSCTLEGDTDDDVILTLFVNGVATTPTMTIPASPAGTTVHVDLLTNNQIPAVSGMSVAVSGDNTAPVPASFTLKCIV